MVNSSLADLVLNSSGDDDNNRKTDLKSESKPVENSSDFLSSSSSSTSSLPSSSSYSQSNLPSKSQTETKSFFGDFFDENDDLNDEFTSPIKKDNVPDRAGASTSLINTEIVKDKATSTSKVAKMPKINDPKYDKKVHKINAKTGVLRFRKFGPFKNKPVYCWSPLKKTLIVGPVALLLSCVLVFAIMFVSSIQSSLSTGGLDGNLADALMKKDPLKKDKFGRSNFLIFGTTQDEPGHGGATLADSILVLSIDQESGKSNIVSIPRDLYYPAKATAPGERTWTGKFNEAFYYGTLMSKHGTEAEGCEYFMKQVANIIGTDVQYYAKMDMGGLMSVVDVVGGIDVHPWTETPSRGLYDFNQSITIPKLEEGETIHLNGDQALRLSRARNSEGGYGLPASNFDREKNQQIILNAVRDKANTSGFIANPLKVAQFIQSIGTHMLTNLKMSELNTVLESAKKMTRAIPLPLQGTNDDKEFITLVVNGQTDSGASIVRPALGIGQYDDIRNYIAYAFSNGTQGEKTKGRVVGDFSYVTPPTSSDDTSGHPTPTSSPTLAAEICGQGEYLGKPFGTAPNCQSTDPMAKCKWNPNILATSPECDSDCEWNSAIPHSSPACKSPTPTPTPSTPTTSTPTPAPSQSSGSGGSGGQTPTPTPTPPAQAPPAS